MYPGAPLAPIQGGGDVPNLAPQSVPRVEPWSILNGAFFLQDSARSYAYVAEFALDYLRWMIMCRLNKNDTRRQKQSAKGLELNFYGIVVNDFWNH